MEANNSKNNYIIGVCWFLLSLLTSVINDAISKSLGSNLPCVEVSFFRFLFSTLTLIPFIIYYGKSSLVTSNHSIHIVRGAILFIGVTSWTFGLTVAPITTATVISFTIPIFTLILAKIFLKENVIWQRWVASLVGFLGIALVLGAANSNFNTESLIFIFAAIGFATLDVINKKFVVQETMISMLFYSALVTTILSLIPAYLVWKTPNFYEIILFFILGTGANLILFFILKAFKLAEASAIAPYRYLELFIASIVGFLLFNEIPTYQTLIGAMIIIPSTLFIIYSESKKNSKVTKILE